MEKIKKWKLLYYDRVYLGDVGDICLRGLDRLVYGHVVTNTYISSGQYLTTAFEPLPESCCCFPQIAETYSCCFGVALCRMLLLSLILHVFLLTHLLDGIVAS